jgi:hypothetical protein
LDKGLFCNLSRVLADITIEIYQTAHEKVLMTKKTFKKQKIFLGFCPFLHQMTLAVCSVAKLVTSFTDSKIEENFERADQFLFKKRIKGTLT